MSEFDVFISRLKEGADNVYFRDVIKSSTGHAMLPVSPRERVALRQIKTHFDRNLRRIKTYVRRNIKGRSNELSNKMEVLVANEIEKIGGFKAERPETTKGGRQTAAYPDWFITKGAVKFYLEVKVFQTKNKDSSLRAFYYKVSENNKITTSCPHTLIAFEIDALGGNNTAPFLIKEFKLLDLYKLTVSLKPEFNVGNKEMYAICDQV